MKKIAAPILGGIAGFIIISITKDVLLTILGFIVISSLFLIVTKKI